MQTHSQYLPDIPRDRDAGNGEITAGWNSRARKSRRTKSISIGDRIFEGILELTPAFKELDFPFHVPSNVISCGPIHRKRTPLSTSDPELETWLTKPTVLISLGSHVRLPESVAIQMAKGVRAVIIARSELKVLWKLKYDSDGSGEFQEVLGSFIAAGSVKVVSWIQEDIMSILETGRIATYVHHGGANSSFEACKYVSISLAGRRLGIANCSISELVLMSCYHNGLTPMIVQPGLNGLGSSSTAVELQHLASTRMSSRRPCSMFWAMKEFVHSLLQSEISVKGKDA